MRHRTLLLTASLLTVAASLPGPSSPAAAAPLAAVGAAVTAAAMAAIQPAATRAGTARPPGDGRLPTGARLDPAGRSFDLGNMPLAMALAPEGDRVVVLLAGWREQGIQVVEMRSGRVLQTVEL
ncbi:MAG: hypothetical protein JOZ15_00330, partial [Acidobacteria bacterium]|nr:hypothetical protein [Acidobacteriota bacterium]